MKTLIITCDDCGMAEGINEATLSLHERQIATAASVITNFPAVQHAYALFAPYPALACGIHLNLTEGYPLRTVQSTSPLIRGDGRFRSRVALFAQALHPTASFMALVEAELTAQVEHFLQSGLAAHHLTTHLHFHTVPALRTVVFRLAQRFNIEWVRAHRLAATVLPFNLFLQRGQLRPEPGPSDMLFQPDYLIPIKFWLGTSPAALLGRLKTLQGRVEIVVHPSTLRDPSFPAGMAYLPPGRFQELQYLEEVMHLLQSSH